MTGASLSYYGLPARESDEHHLAEVEALLRFHGELFWAEMRLRADLPETRSRREWNF